MSGTKWAATFAIFLCTGVTSVTCDHGLHAKLSSVKRQGQDAGDNPIASQVAEALAKGLEESLKGKQFYDFSPFVLASSSPFLKIARSTPSGPTKVCGNA